MSTYIDSKDRFSYGGPEYGYQSWKSFTNQRLLWIYGPHHRADRAAMTARDVEAWERMGNVRPQVKQPKSCCDLLKQSAKRGQSTP